MHVKVMFMIYKLKTIYKLRCIYHDNNCNHSQQANPSISASNWLTVWLAYGCIAELVRFWPTESISSMKITQGARVLATAKIQTFRVEIEETANFEFFVETYM